MDIKHFLIKTKMARCINCNGTGIVDVKCERVCRNCNGTMSSGIKCYVCENTWKWGNTEECNVCWGTGEIILEVKETEKKALCCSK